MHKIKNVKGGFAEKFLRANSLAVFTESHESHSDTQYRYTLIDSSLKSEEYKSEKWRVIYRGSWYEFINKHLSTKPEFQKLHEVTNKEGNTALLSEEILEENSRKMFYKTLNFQFTNS